MNSTLLSTDHSAALVALAHAEGIFPDYFVNDGDNWDLLDRLAAGLLQEPMSSLALDAANALLAYDHIVTLAPEYNDWGIEHVVHRGIEHLLAKDLIHDMINGDALSVLPSDMSDDGIHFLKKRSDRVISTLTEAIRCVDLLAQEYHFLLSGTAKLPAVVHSELFMGADRARKELRGIHKSSFRNVETYVILHLLVELFDEVHRPYHTLEEGLFEFTTGKKPWLGWKPKQFRGALLGHWTPPGAAWASAWTTIRASNSWLFAETDRLLTLAHIGPEDFSPSFRTVLKNRLLPLCAGISAVAEGRGTFLSPFRDRDVLRAWDDHILDTDRFALDSARALKLIIGEADPSCESPPNLKKLASLKSRSEYEDYRHALEAITRQLAGEDKRGDSTVILAAARELIKIQSATKTDKTLSAIGRVLAYASVPVNILELCLSLPPIAGLTMGLVGKGLQARTDFQSKKKNWIALVRDV